ncbi:MAG: PAS domain S-box protein [Gallionellaceae bacterium]|jgi:PAS domain S-box-containing protein
MEGSSQHVLEWFSSDGFMPHGHCYLWTPELLWTFVISESIIVLAYFSIAFSLLYFVRKRHDLQFNWMFQLFSLFIFACGATHLADIWTIWYPDYWLNALIKAFTAGVSLIAAVLLWRLIPKALKIPSTQLLEESNSQLQAEIERRNTTEAELSRVKQSSDERYRILFEQAAIGVAEVDTLSGAFLHVNQKLCNILGYERNELLRKSFDSFIHADDLPAMLLNIMDLKVGRITDYAMEERCIHKDGSIRWLRIAVSPTWEPGAIPTTHIAIMHDITARKLADERLQEKLDELQRWHEVTLNRESRIQALKREVNEILIRNGESPRYASVAKGNSDA